ncbi:MAG TPA: heparinase II/III family protein [Armatimonadota bacterium]|nr:heparinase II/III family protein [Armatimonadota bacterium]
MGFDFRLALGLAAGLVMLLALMTLRAEEEQPAHPRLYFGPRDLPRLAKLGYAAPKLLDESGFDPKLGPSGCWTVMAARIRSRLESLGLSYAVTGDRRYAQRAAEYMLALADWPTWSGPDGSDHTRPDTCFLTMGAAFAYDACWEAMSGPERQRVREALLRRGLTELAQALLARVEGPPHPLRGAALGLGGLALLPEYPPAWDYVRLAKDCLRQWLDRRAVSPNTEGLLHTLTGLDYCLLFAAALAQAEGDHGLIHHPYVAQAVRWALYFQGPAGSGLVNFGDAHADDPGEVTMRVANKHLRDPYAGYYLQQAGRLERRDFNALILHDPRPLVAWPPPWPASARFAHIGWAALRSGWGDDDTLFAFISSSSPAEHRHGDANHFVLNCAGEWLATDSGGRSRKDGAAMDLGAGTAEHNSVLVGGAGQREGAAAVTDFFASPGFDYVVGDASRAYDPQILWRFLRRVIYVKPSLLVMLDELEAPGPKRFEFVLHTDATGRYEINGKPAKAGETRAAQQVSLVKRGARLDVRFLEPTAAQVSLGQVPGAADDYPPYVTVRDSRPRESQRFLTTLMPTRLPPAPVTIELDEQAGARDSLVRLDSYGALLFRARDPGDRLIVNALVPVEGTYDLTAHFLKSPAYADWQVFVDGQPVGSTYRGYAPDVRTREAWELGRLELARGRHEFVFEVTGKHELSSGCLVGVDDIELKPVAAAAPPSPPGPTRLRRLGAEGWVGLACMVGGERCRAYFRLTGADDIADKDLHTDAEAALVVEGAKREPQVAAYRATRFEVAGRELMQASAPISFALVPGETWSLTLQADDAADVVLHLSEQPRRPDIPASLARGVRYDPTAPALRIRLRPGSHTITWGTR